jgi:hypothetical protein
MVDNEYRAYLNSNESGSYTGVLIISQGKSQESVSISLDVEFEEEILPIEKEEEEKE